MAIFQGIQLVFAHVTQFFQSIGNWWTEVSWRDWVQVLPISLQTTMTVIISIMLVMAAIGLVKKLSFMLG